MRHLRVFLLLLTTIFAVVGCVSTPGEFEPQKLIMFQAPTYNNIDAIETIDAQVEMMAPMLLAGDVVDLTLNPPEEDLLGVDEAEYKSRLMAAGVSNFSNLRIREVSHSDIWARDNFPFYINFNRDPRDLQNTLGLTTAQQQLLQQRYATVPLGYSGQVVLNLIFDGWGYEPFSSPDITVPLYQLDNDIAPTIAAQQGLPMVSSPLVAEPGGLESDGNGTLFYAEKAFLQRQIYNPTGPGGQPMTAAQIRDEVAAITASPNPIGVPYSHPLDGHSVIDGPLYLDVDNDGIDDPLHFPFTVNHTDEVLKLVDEDTILVAQLPQSAVTNPIEQDIHDTLEDLWDFLADQVNVDGEPYELVAYPDPGLTVMLLTEDDDIWLFLGELAEDYGMTGGLTLQDYNPAGGYMISAGTYINFATTDHVVTVPQFYGPGMPERLQDTDAEAMDIAADLYPNHEIVPLYLVSAVNMGGGGPHCITMHQPE